MFLGRVFGDKSCFCSMKSLAGRAFAGEVNTIITIEERIKGGNENNCGRV